MNNSLFYPRTKTNDRILQEIILKYNMTLDYECKRKRVYSNEELLLKIDRNFFFLYILDSRSMIMREIRKQLSIS